MLSRSPLLPMISIHHGTAKVSSEASLKLAQDEFPARTQVPSQIGHHPDPSIPILVLRATPPSFAQAQASKCRPTFNHAHGIFRLLSLVSLILVSVSAFGQGGPPYYTNDPGTPGPLNWEINLGYMPFFYGDQSVSHTPDVDINFAVGERIHLTYENAWLRVQNPGSKT